ncbi:unnamed protein product [Lactuca virosa]|uniref:Uncharacterized protein n=1 Tax=Lactuca virosa TaxID=75947 RepID=A0AAU9PR43_9ASTR|nr:unnamed protein product [Lactuca virosa]
MIAITNRDFCSHSSSPESGLQVLGLTRNRGGLLAFDGIGDCRSQRGRECEGSPATASIGRKEGKKGSHRRCDVRYSGCCVQLRSSSGFEEVEEVEGRGEGRASILRQPLWLNRRHQQRINVGRSKQQKIDILGEIRKHHCSMWMVHLSSKGKGKRK